ncbi:hypothetical protein BDY24DRAFT_398981 [Mrakia frigida]|uniref:uncharacterized protein n=1 Tax=Mrakia frigida TaxID=29902 RepID=UPI003FCBFC23
MSPIIKFHNEDGPPPFSNRRQPRATRPNPSQTEGQQEDEDEESDGHSFPPPSYPPLPSSTPPPSTKPKDRRRPQDDYGDYEAGEDETEGNGLLYEMEDLGGRLDGQLDTLSRRRARGEASIGGDAPGLFGVTRPTKAAWAEIREMMYETTPTLMLTLLGLVFTGELLEHLSHWRVFERVDELFILYPMIANLKGNLEMCLGARLSTSANIGELDSRPTRRSLILGQLSLLQLQALAVSFLAAILSFLLGLTMPHRISDDPSSVYYNATLHRLNSTSSSPSSRTIALAGMFFERGDDPDAGYIDTFKEGFTPPPGVFFLFILVTGMLATSLSGGILGSFISALVVLCRRLRINPDNISTPIAACLSDLVTLFILGIVGTILLPYIATPVPFVFLPLLILAGAGFTWSTLRNEHVKGLVRDGWTPLLAAVTISSATGIVLEQCVGKYEGFAILAVALTGLSGAVGSIHASRLSTILHQAHPPSPAPGSGYTSPSPITPHFVPHPSDPPPDVAAPRAIAVALFVIALPVQLFFLLFVGIAGWMRVGEWQLVVSFVLVFALTVFISIWTADRLTLFFWSRNLDPDSYTLPIHSSLIDLIGQVLLVVAFEIAAAMGGNVRVIDG